jgi:hypothetical protein
MKRYLYFLLTLFLITACDLSSPLETPPPLCEEGQTENCTPTGGDTGGGTPNNPSTPTTPGTPTNPNTPTNPGTPANPVTPTDPANPGTPGNPPTTPPTNPTPTDPPTSPTNPGTPTDPGTPANPGTPTDPNQPGNPTPPTPPTTPTDPNPPRGCGTTARVRSGSTLSSQTTFQSCYAPGASSTVFLSYRLLDSSVTMANPTLVFDMVRVNADRSTTSVAGDLLDGRPSANPNIFEGSISKDQLLTGLRAAVAFRFKASAPEGKYVMVISLFRDGDAFNSSNLVGRVFYDFEIKR